jgi:putative transposase
MQYRRSTAKGATFFFTVVTHNRCAILCHESNVSLLREAFLSVMERHPFTIDAFVLLPDHLHCIWTLPENDSNFSMRWRQIKSHFSRRCLDGFKGLQTTTHLEKGEQAIWQHRFWEHQVRDDDDFIEHVEYIHYNPVKHGLVKSPKLWPHSTFPRYVKQELYHVEWGANTEVVFGQEIGKE